MGALVRSLIHTSCPWEAWRWPSVGCVSSVRKHKSTSVCLFVCLPIHPIHPQVRKHVNRCCNTISVFGNRKGINLYKRLQEIHNKTCIKSALLCIYSYCKYQKYNMRVFFGFNFIFVAKTNESYGCLSCRRDRRWSLLVQMTHRRGIVVFYVILFVIIAFWKHLAANENTAKIKHI